eukprot:TRINITY_DN11339_c0_g1_i1.p1 TRINITY_DN11339_c0_g1~~TRINITY_DN11339_c0_g1_i1.p1  ORF type:complete len:1011 (-),score=223.41 TRINITY_DN11339_c0_g1_i1:30-3023(-)
MEVDRFMNEALKILLDNFVDQEKATLCLVSSEWQRIVMESWTTLRLTVKNTADVTTFSRLSLNRFSGVTKVILSQNKYASQVVGDIVSRAPNLSSLNLRESPFESGSFLSFCKNLTHLNMKHCFHKVPADLVLPETLESLSISSTPSLKHLTRLQKLSWSDQQLPVDLNSPVLKKITVGGNLNMEFLEKLKDLPLDSLTSKGSHVLNLDLEEFLEDVKWNLTEFRVICTASLLQAVIDKFSGLTSLLVPSEAQVMVLLPLTKLILHGLDVDEFSPPSELKFLETIAMSSSMWNIPALKKMRVAPGLNTQPGVPYREGNYGYKPPHPCLAPPCFFIPSPSDFLCTNLTHLDLSWKIPFSCIGMCHSLTYLSVEYHPTEERKDIMYDEFEHLFNCPNLEQLLFGVDLMTNLSRSTFLRMAKTFKNLEVLRLPTREIYGQDFKVLTESLPLRKVGLLHNAVSYGRKNFNTPMYAAMIYHFREWISEKGSLTDWDLEEKYLAARANLFEEAGTLLLKYKKLNTSQDFEHVIENWFMNGNGDPSLIEVFFSPLFDWGQGTNDRIKIDETSVTFLDINMQDGKGNEHVNFYARFQHVNSNSDAEGAVEFQEIASLQFDALFREDEFWDAQIQKILVFQEVCHFVALRRKLPGFLENVWKPFGWLPEAPTYIARGTSEDKLLTKKGADVISKYYDSKWLASRINLLLTTDKIKQIEPMDPRGSMSPRTSSRNSHVSTTIPNLGFFVAELRACIAWQTPKWNGKVWCASLHSPLELFIMAVTGVFCVPSFISAVLSPQDLDYNSYKKSKVEEERQQGKHCLHHNCIFEIDTSTWPDNSTIHETNSPGNPKFTNLFTCYNIFEWTGYHVVNFRGAQVPVIQLQVCPYSRLLQSEEEPFPSLDHYRLSLPRFSISRRHISAKKLHVNFVELCKRYSPYIPILQPVVAQTTGHPYKEDFTKIPEQDMEMSLLHKQDFENLVSEREVESEFDELPAQPENEDKEKCIIS